MTSDLSRRADIRIPAGHGEEIDACTCPMDPVRTQSW